MGGLWGLLTSAGRSVCGPNPQGPAGGKQFVALQYVADSELLRASTYFMLEQQPNGTSDFATHSF